MAYLVISAPHETCRHLEMQYYNKRCLYMTPVEEHNDMVGG